MTISGPVARPAPLLVALAGVSVVLPVALVVVSALPAVPAPLAVVLGVVASIVAAVLLALLVRRARPEPGGRRLVLVTCVVALGLSVAIAATVTIASFARTPPLSMLSDAGAHAWMLVVLLLIAVPARTVSWLRIGATLLCGYLAVAAVARLVGIPVVQALGVGDPLATSLWVPLTEELLKVAPAAIFVLLALRSRLLRPAAVDIGLLGAASGAGFALTEDAAAGGVFSRGDAPFPLSVLLPTLRLAGRGDVFHVFAGHAVWTGLLGLGIGVAVLYGRRYRFAWVAAPAAFLVVFPEHAIYNLAGAPPALLVPIAGGLLSPVLLLAGFLGLAVLERRRPLRPVDVLSGLGLTSPTVQSAALAIRQGASRQGRAAG